MFRVKDFYEGLFCIKPDVLVDYLEARNRVFCDHLRYYDGIYSTTEEIVFEKKGNFRKAKKNYRWGKRRKRRVNVRIVAD